MKIIILITFSKFPLWTLPFTYQELFSEWKNSVPNKSYSTFKSQKYIHLHCSCNLNRDFSKLDFKSISSYKFCGRSLKLGNYVLGNKTFEWADFNWGLRSEIMNFWKLLVGKNHQKWTFWNFKNSYFHFWDLNKKSAPSEVLS